MTSKLYIPLIRKPGIGEPPVPDPEPTPEPPIEPHVPEPEPELNLQEREILALLMSHPGQKRLNIRCDARLAAAARAKAEQMGTRAYFSHTDPSGESPNAMVRAAGLSLPAHYPDNANSIESIAAGHVRAVDAWSGWMASEGHRSHLLGLNLFWQEQSVIGIGFSLVEDSPYQRYWVVLSIPPPE